MNHMIKKARVTKPPVVVQPTPRVPSSRPSQETNLQRVQGQAEKRVKLGVQLLNAAQSQANRQQTLFDQMALQHQHLRDEVQHDIAKSLQTYDQWMASFDQRFTARLQAMEEKVDAMQQNWSVTEKQIASVVHLAQKLLDHTRSLRQPAGAGQPSPAAQIAAPPTTTNVQSHIHDQPTSLTTNATPCSKETPRETNSLDSVDPQPNAIISRDDSKTAKDTAQPSTKAPPEPLRPDLIFSKALQEVRRQQPRPPVAPG